MPSCLDLLSSDAKVLWSGSKDGARSLSRALRCARLLGPLEVEAVDDRSLDTVAAGLVAQGLGPSTVNRHLAALSKLLRWSHRRGLLSRLPYRAREPEPEGRTTVLGPVDRTKVLAWFQENTGVPYRDLLEFLWATGFRVGEAVGLKASDVTVDPKGRAWATVRATKNGTTRSVPLSAAAVGCVNRALTLSGPAGAGGMNPLARNVFEGVKRSSLSHAWVRCRRALNLHPGLVLHSLRHTRASELVNAGVPLAHVQAWLGHKSVRTTLRYAHTDRQSLERALEATGEI